MKKFTAAAVLLALALMLPSCSVQNAEEPAAQKADEKYFAFTARDLDASYNEQTATKITFADGKITADGNGAEIDGNSVTVKKDGVFILSGTSPNASVTVDISKEKKLQLVLDGLTLHSEESPAIYVKSADKVFLTLAEGSKNSLSDGTYELVDGETALDAAIFSKEDFTVNGTGSLTVTGNTKHGIVSKDDLVITGGNVNVTSVKKSLSAKDSVKIGGGDITLTAGSDGIHAENADDAILGVVYIAGGKLAVTAESDGIQAQSEIRICGGEINVSAGDDGIHSDKEVNINGGDVNVEKSYEGIEGSSINVTDGNVYVKSDDDGMNATGTRQAEGEMPQMPDGEMPQMPDGEMPQMPDGEMPQKPDGEMPQKPDGEMPQMPDGEMPQMPDGEMPQKPDGGMEITPVRAGPPDKAPDKGGERGGFDGGFMGGDFRGGFGKGGGPATDAEINISGGYVYIDAGGDGIDSNGTFTISGGTVLISGPASDGDSALDYETSAKAAGGTLIALGSSAMSEGFTEANEGAIMLDIPTQIANASIAICDKNGDVVLAFSSKKECSNIVAASPLFVVGESYTVTAGAALTDADKNGFAQSGKANGGAVLMQFELTAELYNASRGRR